MSLNGRPTMSDRAAALRQRAIDAGTQPQTLYLLLDPQVRLELAQHEANLQALCERLAVLQLAESQDDPQPASLADTEPTVSGIISKCTELIGATEKVIADIKGQADADDLVLRVLVRRCTPARYRQIDEDARVEALQRTVAAKAKGDAEQYNTSDEEHLLVLGDMLLAEGYIDCATADGEHIDMPLQTLIDDVIDDSDLQEMRGFAIGINKRGSSVDFSRVSSGRAVQS